MVHPKDEIVAGAKLTPTTLLNGYLMKASFPVREIGTVMTLLHASHELEDLIHLEHLQRTFRTPLEPLDSVLVIFRTV
jgi:hypothetical protein